MRRQQILDATVQCVRRKGFHGASMSDIAAGAQVSVGAIYRYFTSKESIIEAIVANNLAEMRDTFAEWDDTPDDALLDRLLNVLGRAIERRFGGDYSELGLEILAEAGRNPRVAAIVENADAQERQLGRNLCQRLMPDVEPALVEARSEIVSMLFDGMMARAIANPSADRGALLADLRTVVRLLFAPSPKPLGVA